MSDLPPRPSLPVSNLRRRIPRVCGHCRFLTYPGDGTSKCTLPNGPQWDSGDGYEWMYVCDLFTRYDPKRDKPAH